MIDAGRRKWYIVSTRVSQITVSEWMMGWGVWMTGK